MNKLTFSFQNLLTTVIFLSSFSYAQELTEEFLEGLDPLMRDQLENQNSVNDDELDALFRSETSIEKNKEILLKLKTQI